MPCQQLRLRMHGVHDASHHPAACCKVVQGACCVVGQFGVWESVRQCVAVALYCCCYSHVTPWQYTAAVACCVGAVTKQELLCCCCSGKVGTVTCCVSSGTLHGAAGVVQHMQLFTIGHTKATPTRGRVLSFSVVALNVLAGLLAQCCSRSAATVLFVSFAGWWQAIGLFCVAGMLVACLAGWLGWSLAGLSMYMCTACSVMYAVQLAGSFYAIGHHAGWGFMGTGCCSCRCELTVQEI